MIHETVRFAEKFEDAYLESYIHSHDSTLKISKRNAIIVCPGGGYTNLSEREAEPVALRYFAAGLNVFVLRYSVGAKAANCAPLIEACLAIKYLRDNCGALHVDPDHVFITGFSAGGHLAAWAGCRWHSPEVCAHLDGADPEICKPTATIPCYPVITSTPGCRHPGSFWVLNGMLKDDKGMILDEEGMSRFSLEQYVDERTSPAFLWHTANDGTVPVQSSLFYAAKLAEYNIPFELHIYPQGPHGLALSNKETWVGSSAHYNQYVAGWIDLALHWISER